MKQYYRHIKWQWTLYVKFGCKWNVGNKFNLLEQPSCQEKKCFDTILKEEHELAQRTAKSSKKSSEMVCVGEQTCLPD